FRRVLFRSIYIFSSCNDLLDVKQGDYVLDSDIYYSNKTQINAALNGVYAVLADGSLYGNYLQGRMGLEADEGFYRDSFDDNTVTYYEASSSDPKILNYWTWLYRGINRANALLENLDKPKDLTREERQDIRRQALFLRGYFYFLLVNKFGGVPLVLESTTSENVTDYQVPRSPIKVVYGQILEDMHQA